MDRTEKYSFIGDTSFGWLSLYDQIAVQREVGKIEKRPWGYLKRVQVIYKWRGTMPEWEWEGHERTWERRE